jgi:GNAT superfamily N-acetyltransferase
MCRESRVCTLRRGLKLTQALFPTKFYRTCPFLVEFKLGKRFSEILPNLMTPSFMFTRRTKCYSVLARAVLSEMPSSRPEGGFEGELGAIYVLKQFQGKSVGWALMQRIASDLSARGFRGMVSAWAWPLAVRVFSPAAFDLG